MQASPEAARLGSCFLWMRSGEAGCTVGRRCSASRGRVFGGSSASRSEFGALAYTSAADAVLEGTKTSEAGEKKTAGGYYSLVGASFTSSFTCAEISHASLESDHSKLLTLCLLSSLLRVHISLLRHLSFLPSPRRSFTPSLLAKAPAALPDPPPPDF